MSAAAVLLLAVVGTLVPIAVLRPWIGFLGYTWLSFMVPHRLVGGAVANAPLAKVIALATLVGLLFTDARHPLPRRRELLLLVTFWVVCAASTVFVALQPERAWTDLAQFSKIVLMTGVALVLFRDRRKLRWWLVVIALSIGALAIGGGAYAMATGFARLLFGPPGSIVGDNNSLGFALTMVAPLLALLAVDEERPWLRPLLLVGFFFTLVAVVATYSRGSFVGLCVVVPLLLFLVPDKTLIVTTCAAALTVAVLAPPPWRARVETITPAAYRETQSGAQRMRSWYAAWRLGTDHPLLGAGFRPFSPPVYERYVPGYSDYHDAHNHWLQVLAEHGFVGLTVFVALLASVAGRLWHVLSSPPRDPSRAWTKPVAQMVLLSLVAYAVGGIFINSPYFELLYQLMAVAIVVDDMARSAGAAEPTVARPLAAVLADRLRRP